MRLRTLLSATVPALFGLTACSLMADPWLDDLTGGVPVPQVDGGYVDADAADSAEVTPSQPDSALGDVGPTDTRSDTTVDAITDGPVDTPPPPPKTFCERVGAVPSENVLCRTFEDSDVTGIEGDFKLVSDVSAPTPSHVLKFTCITPPCGAGKAQAAVIRRGYRWAGKPIQWMQAEMKVRVNAMDDGGATSIKGQLLLGSFAYADGSKMRYTIIFNGTPSVIQSCNTPEKCENSTLFTLYGYPMTNPWVAIAYRIDFRGTVPTIQVWINESSSKLPHALPLLSVPVEVQAGMGMFSAGSPASSSFVEVDDVVARFEYGSTPPPSPKI